MIQDNGPLTLSGHDRDDGSNYALTVNGGGTTTFSNNVTGGGSLNLWRHGVP